MKEQVTAATKQAQRAEKAAKDAKASQLFAYAVNEDDSSKAETLLTQVIQLCPQNAEAYYYRAHQKKDYEEALRDYDKAIEINPLYIDALDDRGNLKICLNDNIGAIDDFDRVIKLAPLNPSAYVCRGIAKENTNDKKGAMMDYNRSIELDPKRFYTYIKRGHLKFVLNDISGALNDLNKSLEITPNYPETLECRAKCYRKLAEDEQDDNKKTEWIAKAEADEKIKLEFDARAKAQKERIEILNNIQS